MIEYQDWMYSYLNTPDKEYLTSLKGKIMTLEDISKLDKCFRDIDEILEQVDPVLDHQLACIDLDLLDGYIPGVSVKVLGDFHNITPQSEVKILDWYIDS